MSSVLFVDGARCTGHGRCYATAPGLLEQDEQGFVSVRDSPIEFDEAHLELAYEVEMACPEGAISVARNTTTGGSHE